MSLAEEYAPKSNFAFEERHLPPEPTASSRESGAVLVSTWTRVASVRTSSGPGRTSSGSTACSVAKRQPRSSGNQTGRRHSDNNNEESRMGEGSTTTNQDGC